MSRHTDDVRYCSDCDLYYGSNAVCMCKRPDSIEDMLQAIYDREANIEISNFFDAGWQMSVGDTTNGYMARKQFDDLKTGVMWLYDYTVVGRRKG